ncbi:putative mitochondrial protein [Apostasia shenzhenica]|uniref:Putative mitochondrial protein n=1 Tax=Apostasia shenzhenica TaxID=1088818 RepID=A0A2I0B7T8_9ASPA|nr:putative mitochondrial protein [Apostasia shenzhenica]
MPFDLKNAGATYQRMIDRIFKNQRGRNLEAYVDDILVKSKTLTKHLGDLRETLDTLRRYNLKLNPAKCTFGTASGKILGYLVSVRGIEANPDKISAIQSMPSPKTAKEIQKLAGQINSLGRFISKAGDRCSPFFRCLRNNKKGQWDGECEAAFIELKKYLTSAPVLVAPKEGSILSLYLGVSDTAVSAVLLDSEKEVQHPIFYTSHILLDTESRYPTLEKLALALLMTARKLQPYFQSHTIQVITDQPLLKILHTPEVSGRLLKWSVELGEYDIRFVPRTAIKAQALADFVAEFSTTDPPPTETLADLWSLHVDGASGSQSQGAGILLTIPMGATLHQAVTLQFKATNNQAEYEALIAGLNFTLSMAIKRIQVFSNSLLVVNQVNQTFEMKDEVLKKYLQLARSLISLFENFSLTHIPREENQVADRLAKEGHPDLHRTQVFERRSFECTEVSSEKQPPCWMDEILNYLKSGTQPDNRREAQKLKLACAKYALIDGELYRRSYAKPLTKCLRPDEALKVMEAIHRGECGTHARGRSLVMRILR